MNVDSQLKELASTLILCWKWLNIYLNAYIKNSVYALKYSQRIVSKMIFFHVFPITQDGDTDGMNTRACPTNLLSGCITGSYIARTRLPGKPIVPVATCYVSSDNHFLILCTDCVNQNLLSAQHAINSYFIEAA